MSTILTLLCGLAFAEPVESEELPPAEAESEKEKQEPVKEESAEEAAVDDQQTKPPPSKETLIKIEVTLKNGLNVDGEIERKEAIGWEKGKPLQIWAENEWLELKAGSIESINTTKKANSASASSSENTQPVLVKIKEEPLPKSVNGFDFPNYSASRYLYSPSALSVPKGHGYVSQKYFIFTSAAYGVTDNLTILGGTFSLFPPAISILGFKYSVELNETIHIGFGGESFMTAFGVSSNNPFLANIGFANITFGHEDRNVTFAGGIGEIDGQLSYPVAVSGLTRVTSNVAFMTENWFIVAEDGSVSTIIPSVAARYMKRPTGSDGYSNGQFVDFGMIAIVNFDSYIGGFDTVPIPWIDMGWTF